jgi:hypothetical protein
MLTLVYAYFNNGNMIGVHQQYWREFACPERCRAIIVDDCSKEQPLSAYRFDVGFPVRRFRIKTDIPWNQDGARNLAMTNAKGWCALLDMDHVLPAEAEEKIHSMVKDPKVVYKFTRVNPEGKKLRKPGANIFLMHSDLFWKVGGYDERFAGYYGSDINFIRRLRLHAEFVFTDISLVTYSQGYVSGASTNEYGRKGTAYDITNSPHYHLLGQTNKPSHHLNFEWEELV